MRIVIVNDYARIVGGAAKVAIQSAQALAEAGHQVDFFAAGGVVGPELSSTPSIRVTCLDAGPHNRDSNKLRGALNGLWFRRAAKEVRRLLEPCDPKDTVVHFHAYRDILTASVADTALNMGFVTVYTAHEYSMGCPYGGFFDYRKKAICTLEGSGPECRKTHCNTGPFLKKRWYFMAQSIYGRKRIAERFSHVIFISKLNERVLSPYLPASVRRSIVSNPADFRDASQAHITADSPFLYIGALEPHKDPVTAARAARLLGAPIVFVGAGGEESAIRAENPDAIVTGWVGREEVGARMQSARALVFPSIWYEAQPLTPMEAAACGVPLIVSDVSAAREFVEQLRTGDVFRAGDAAHLAERMRPYTETNHAQKQGEATRMAFQKLDLGVERHVNALLDIYKTELAASSR